MINEFTPTQVRNDFEEIKEGCVGIQILKDVSVTLTDMIQTDTVGSIQSLLNRPKAIFIGSLLLEILDMNFVSLFLFSFDFLLTR
jgi:hypothetical protein